MFKNKLNLLIVSLMTVVAIVGCSAVQAAPQGDAQAQTVQSGGLPRTITVVGAGKVFLTPDIAKITVGAEATAPTVSDAKSQVDVQIKAILNALKELGIEDKDIQTSNYSIYFDRNASIVKYPEAMPEAQSGYNVSNTLQVTVRDISTVGDVLDAVIEAGANQVYGIHFTVSENALWEGQAREKAIADARTRAQELAKLSGVELGKVVSVSEVIGGNTYYPVADRAAYGMGGGSDIAVGELEMSTQVQVIFEIK